jgi:hypothetical protein
MGELSDSDNNLSKLLDRIEWVREELHLIQRSIENWNQKPSLKSKTTITSKGDDQVA